MPTPFGRIRIAARAAGCVALTAAVPPPASADTGIPLIALVSPGFWLILPLVILVESVVALLIWAVLLVPFLFVSVWIEGLVAVRVVDKEDRRRAWLWTWLANAASYTLIA